MHHAQRMFGNIQEAFEVRVSKEAMHMHVSKGFMGILLMPLFMSVIHYVYGLTRKVCDFL